MTKDEIIKNIRMIIDYLEGSIDELKLEIENLNNSQGKSKEELCECGHKYKEHNYNLIKNNKFPDGKLLGNGECLAFGENGKMYCDCKKFVKKSKGVKKK